MSRTEHEKRLLKRRQEKEGRKANRGSSKGNKNSGGRKNW